MVDLHTRMHTALVAAESHVDPTRPANPAPRGSCEGCGSWLWRGCVCDAVADERAANAVRLRMIFDEQLEAE